MSKFKEGDSVMVFGQGRWRPGFIGPWCSKNGKTMTVLHAEDKDNPSAVAFPYNITLIRTHEEHTRALLVS